MEKATQPNNVIHNRIRLLFKIRDKVVNKSVVERIECLYHYHRTYSDPNTKAKEYYKMDFVSHFGKEAASTYNAIEIVLIAIEFEAAEFITKY